MGTRSDRGCDVAQDMGHRAWGTGHAERGVGGWERDGVAAGVGVGMGVGWGSRGEGRISMKGHGWWW